MATSTTNIAPINQHTRIVTGDDRTWTRWALSASSFTSTITASTWNYWVTGSASTTCGTTSLADTIFRTWVVSSTTEACGTLRFGVAAQASGYINAKVSEEERARREAEAERWRKQAEEERALRIAAEKKAETLLQALLNPQQKEDLAKKNCFYLYSHGKKYRIDRGTHGNVKLVNEKDQVLESYCVQPSGIPVADSMAAQKLLLETDPELLRTIANTSAPGVGVIQHGLPQEVALQQLERRRRAPLQVAAG